MRPDGEQNLPISTVRLCIPDMMALRVRAGLPEKPPPKLLYQLFPAAAMTLLMTIPHGTSAVSIPQQGEAYAIFRNPPAAGTGFVIVYARTPNNRYEAFEVLHEGQSFAVDQFCEVARRWVEKHIGLVKPIPGRYAYLAPTREQWGIVLRDGGYTATAPSGMTFEITREILEQRKDPSGSGVLVRVPLQTGIRMAPNTPIPTFEQIELTLDPLPNRGTRWTGFLEFHQTRALQSRPPDAIVPFFREWLRRLSAESGFDSWVFRRGMFFDDHIEWWGDRNRRRTLHEGIDFAEGRLPGGSLESLAEGVPVRALTDGEVVAFLDDFLNKTVVVRHPGIRNENGDIFHTLLSHIHPEIESAGPVAQGQIVGRVAKSRQVGAPAHLHLTGAWIPESIPAEEISMDQINPAFAPIILVNFNSLINAYPAPGIRK